MPDDRVKNSPWTSHGVRDDRRETALFDMTLSVCRGSRHDDIMVMEVTVHTDMRKLVVAGEISLWQQFAAA